MAEKSIARRAKPGEAKAFFEYALTYAGDDCLIWPFQRNHGGYAFYGKGKGSSACRKLCILRHGDPPTPKHHAAHSCGKGRHGCVNPNHLEWKTPKENIHDKERDDTVSWGTRNGSNRLTEEEVRAIRAVAKKGIYSELARRYGVSVVTIRSIAIGRIWSRLP